MPSYHLVKIVLSVGVGKLREKASFKETVLPEVSNELAAITGQKPSERAAKQSIAGFKVREGDIVGLTVTLRGKKMKDFLDRFIHMTLPRVRDFRGITLKQFDPKGNLTIGLKEHNVFPEINQEQCKVNFGLEITLVTNTSTKEAGIEFLRGLGLPLQK